MFSATSDLKSVQRQSLFWRACTWLIVAAGLILAAGALYQFSRVEWEGHLYPPPGKLVDIGGLRLHINCTGAGSPTVILEAGPNDCLLHL